jgi:prevent-host-death family protein
MNSVSVAALRARIGPLLERAHFGKVVWVTKHGRPYAAIIGLLQLQLLELAIEVSEQLGCSPEELPERVEKYLAQRAVG